MVALSTYGLFLAGISHKRLGYLVPHLCYSVVTILILIVQLYIDLLLVAGSRDATDSSKTLSVFLQVFVIAFEVYTVVILWCVFDYISGWLVSEDLKKEAHANLAKQRSENWCKNSFISLPSQTKDVFVAKEALEQSKSAATFNNYMLI
ncbi:unnamed protein product [Toxocara canis]|nr:unnamed protein product [Toxocara canis]